METTVNSYEYNSCQTRFFDFATLRSQLGAIPLVGVSSISINITNQSEELNDCVYRVHVLGRVSFFVFSRFKTRSVAFQFRSLFWIPNLSEQTLNVLFLSHRQRSATCVIQSNLRVRLILIAKEVSRIAIQDKLVLGSFARQASSIETATCLRMFSLCLRCFMPDVVSIFASQKEHFVSSCRRRSLGNP